MFIGTYLNKNVGSYFRYRKTIPYTRDKNITRTEIILRDTDSLKKIIEIKIKYKYMYEAFDEYHGIPLEMVV